MYESLSTITANACMANVYKALVYACACVCVWHAIALKSAVWNINRNDLSVEHSPDIPLIIYLKWNETKKKNTQNNTQHPAYIIEVLFVVAFSLVLFLFCSVSLSLSLSSGFLLFEWWTHNFYTVFFFIAMGHNTINAYYDVWNRDSNRRINTSFIFLFFYFIYRFGFGILLPLA